jgi:glycosyltransferase involved in cell wall biosynthesis
LVKYEGYVEDARLQELYSNAFGLVFPSHYEGFGLPIVEAMSQACPVIARRNSSVDRASKLGPYVATKVEEVRQRPRFIVERLEGLENDPSARQADFAEAASAKGAKESVHAKAPEK